MWNKGKVPTPHQLLVFLLKAHSIAAGAATEVVRLQLTQLGAGVAL